MGAPKGSKNALGNRGGRSHPVATVDAFYKALDSRLPFVIESVSEVMEWADRQLNSGVSKESSVALQRLKIDAAKVLITKAPDRHVGGDGGAIEIRWKSS